MAFQVTEDVTVPTFGPFYQRPLGGIATRGRSEYRHRFGGESWRVVDRSPAFGGPALVLTLDMRDPVLAGIAAAQIPELPLCSYLACDVWARPQFYQLLPTERRVLLVERNGPATEARFPELRGPLPETRLCIEPMTGADYPTTEGTYWAASNSFVGGSRFIRVVGPPLWLYAVATLTCNCGRTMIYVGSLGYESQAKNAVRSGLLPGEGVFFGEAATYWFFCQHCLTVGVITQST